MPEENHVLFCHCVGRDVGAEAVRRTVLDGLRERGVPFTEVADLCRLAADRNAALTAVASAGPLTVVACHPRAVRGLLASAGIATDESRLRVLDLRALSAEAILAQVPAEAAPAAPLAAAGAVDDWPPWFPIIDLVRCRHCRQCLSFCLFGVYAQSPEGKVIVANPRACKNNCPACARICPDVAIMFPKLPDAEAPLEGAEIDDEQKLRTRARINAREILGDDPYAVLAERQRQARERRLLRPMRERAEAERAAHTAGPGARQPPTNAAAAVPPAE